MHVTFYLVSGRFEMIRIIYIYIYIKPSFRLRHCGSEWEEAEQIISVIDLAIVRTMSSIQIADS